MTWKCRMFCLTGIFIASAGLMAAGGNSDICRKLLDAHVSDVNQKPPTLKLSQSALDSGSMTRACLKSYSSGFPGGEGAFLKANSQSLRSDLDHLQSLFKEVKASEKLPSNNDPDEVRRLHILLGWDREQVLLWGNFFYIRRLAEEGNYSAVVAEVARVRRTFGLEVHPLKTWDQLEEVTYFSKQSLKNMITILEFEARVKVIAPDDIARTTLAESFISNRDALKPFFGITGDPTREIVEPYCKSLAKSEESH
jgi:hypothetical protein